MKLSPKTLLILKNFATINPSITIKPGNSLASIATNKTVLAKAFVPNEFDRVITTCVLHHLNKPLTALNEIRRVTKQNGVISILLPSDPGLIFRIIRKITADRYLKKQGIVNIKFLRATEHRNHVQSLDGMIMHVFQEDSITKRSYPIDRLSWNFSLFTIYQIKVRD